MKAFGVRLAAGAVTILLGAIMAAQAQKDQEANTESAWTEEQIPPAQAVSPIGTEAMLLSAAPMDVKALKPIGEGVEGAEPLDTPQGDTGAVRLVQHTETGDDSPDFQIGMPSATDAPEPDSSAAQIKKMRLPSFDDVPPMDPGPGETQNKATAQVQSAGPSLLMGMPVIGAAAAAAGPDEATTNADAATLGGTVETSDQPKLSGVTFADTPGVQPSAAQVDATDSNGEVAPQNGLRGDAPMGEFSASEFAAPGFDSDSVAGAGELQSSTEIASNPVLSDVGGEPASGPSALLTPVMNGDDPTAGPELAEAPATTMRIQPRSPVQTEIGAEAAPQETPNDFRSVAIPGAIGIASAPRIIGGPDAAANDGPNFAGQVDSAQANLTQEFADRGQTRPASGFSDPPGNGFAPGAMQAGSPQMAVPNLPAPNATPQGFDAPPLGSRQGRSANPALGMRDIADSSQGFGQLPQAAAPAPAMGVPSMGAPAMGVPTTNRGNPIYHGASHQRKDTDPLVAAATMASPGERYLDGQQSPSLVIQKRAPEQVKVGKPATFVILVKNVGQSKALDVQVFDRVPTGMTLTDATPRPNPKYQPELFWELGDLEPGQEKTITLQLTPEQEGELGSVARVTFQAAASVRTVSTRPELKIVQKAPEKVLIGQQLEIELEVSNPGTGEATGVVLQEDVPAGLEHPQGKQLDNLVGTLGPGEIRRQILRMRAVKPGVVQNQIRVKGDDGLETSHTVAVEVVAPQLKASLSGPSRRYLERQATYDLEIANVGTADATNVELSVQLDRGFTFVKTDFEGQYDASRHAVFWSLPTLPVGQSGKVPLTLLPVEEGNRVLRTEASADLGIKATSESQVAVESEAELTFSISDTADPIEIGGDTVYEIRIRNTGSRDDTNVRVAMQLPPGLQLVEEGDFTPKGQGIIEFSPRALLKANDEVTYKVKAKGAAPGRHLVKAIVTSDQSDVPVTKEESIKVYSDR